MKYVLGFGVWQGGNGQSSVYGEGLVDLMNASLYAGAAPGTL